MYPLSEIISLILNILLISIPEELFMAILSLILMRKSNFVTFTKQNIIRMLIPTSVTAISLSTIRIYFEMDMTYAPFLCITIMFLSLILAYKIKPFKEIVKCFFSVLLSFIIIGLVQFSYVPFITYWANINVAKVTDFSLVVFLLSLPERCIEGCILLYVFLKKFSIFKTNIFKIIARKKPIAVASVFICIFNFLFLYLMMMSIAVNRALISLPDIMKVIIIVSVFCFPIVNMAIFVTIIKIFTHFEILKKKNIYDETRTLHLVVKNLIIEKNYMEIEGQFKSFEAHVRNI